MKNTIFAVAFLVIGLVGCKEKQTYPEGAIVLKVTGMDCSNCESLIETELFKIKGITWVQAFKDEEAVAFRGEATGGQLLEAFAAAAKNHGGGKHYQVE